MSPITTRPETPWTGMIGGAHDPDALYQPGDGQEYGAAQQAIDHERTQVLLDSGVGHFGPSGISSSP